MNWQAKNSHGNNAGCKLIMLVTTVVCHENCLLKSVQQLKAIKLVTSFSINNALQEH